MTQAANPELQIAEENGILKYVIVACVVAATVAGGILGVVSAYHEWLVRESVDVVVWIDTENPDALRLSTKSAGGTWVTHDEALGLQEPSPTGRWQRTDAVTVALDFPQEPLDDWDQACLYASRVVESQGGRYKVDGCYAMGRSQVFYVRGTVDIFQAERSTWDREVWEICVWTTHRATLSRNHESQFGVSGRDWRLGVWHQGPAIDRSPRGELADVVCPGGPLYVDGVEATPEEIEAMRETLAP